MLARGDTKTADGDSIDEKQLTAKYAARLNPDRHYSRAIAFFVFTSFLLRLLFRSYFCNVLASYSLHSRIKADGSLKIDEKKKKMKNPTRLFAYTLSTIPFSIDCKQMLMRVLIAQNSEIS